MLLVVSATDDVGTPLTQVGGPTVPGWGGAEAGQPGTVFAKVLRDESTGAFPVVSYWRQALIISDNRLPALAADSSVYTFSAPPTGPANMTARLIFRRVFHDVADQKGWHVPDTLMETISLQIP